MVASSPISIHHKKAKAVGIPTIDLSIQNKLEISRMIISACEKVGFFKIINHGVPKEAVSRMRDEGTQFFAKTMTEKQRAGPARPFGFGCKNIGVNGDMGELEYLLLHTNPLDISERSQSINSNDPIKFSSAVNNYVQAVRGLACEVLDLAAEGLWVPDKSIFSRLIRDVHSDSVIRLNHYAPTAKAVKHWDPSPQNIGFGEHSDPQILSILTSNDVAGLQICLQDGLWVAVPADPTSFYVIVGDALQALTNGRFVSARHRVLANSTRQRSSIIYFGAPPLDSWISPMPEMVSSQNPSLYKPFTWSELKQAAYSLRLGDTRLDRFKSHT